jgi:hypothetical protein
MARRVPVAILSLAALLLALPSSTSVAAGLPKAPVVTSVAPMTLGIGDTLTIKGRNFVAGRMRNTVVFQRVRARAVFVRADEATKTQIRLRIPAKLLPFLSQRGGKAIPTRFRLRVLARRFGVAFTATRLSPTIGPVGTGKTEPVPAPSVGVTDCDRDGVDNGVEADDDNDLLPDSLETQIKTDGCNPDSDSDTVEDGYEYHSALDLNSRALPYPGKRPYPNPLDGSDANTDYDGDGMLQREEYAAWIRYFPHTLGSNGRLSAYSDGDQTTQGELPVPDGRAYLNNDSSCDWCSGSAYISDDELDVDGDGLGNWDEIRGAFDARNLDHISYRPLLDFLDPDTDGDTVVDGEDDQDHDDVSNVQEIQQDPLGYKVKHRFDTIASNAMDPCTPNVNSRSCPLHPEE